MAKKLIKNLSLDALVGIIVLMEIRDEPLHGFTCTEIHRELRKSYTGTMDDLKEKLEILRRRNPACLKEGKYWGTPRE